MSVDPADGSEAAADLSAGFLVGGGRYTLVRPIAPGGMGVVWLAHDERLNESVALKFISAAVRNDATALARLRQETQKSRKLTHPNIIRIYDLFEAPGEPAFISMEHIDGPNLWELMARQPGGVLSWARLEPLVKQLCGALACAHAERVIHRDIKPTNLMLAENDRLKLADFGLAGAALQVDPASFERHFGGGTLTHMSPQQLQGDPAAVTDDIYSAGATLYDLLCGRPPFCEGNIAHQVLNDPAPPLEERLAALKAPNDVPPGVAAMIMACLAKDPSKRPPSALAMAERIVAPASAPAAVPHLASTVFVPPAAVLAAPARRRWPWVAFACALIVAGLFYWLRPDKAPIEIALPPLTNAVAPAPRPVPTVEARPSNAAAVRPVIPVKSPATATLLDASFDAGRGPDGDINALAWRPGGGILVGGHFDSFNGVPRRGLASLGQDGKLNSQNAAIDGTVNSIVQEADGHILIAGEFNLVHGTLRPRLARLGNDLSLDPLFYASEWPDGEIFSMVMDANKIFIAGAFKHIGQAMRPGVARLDAGGHIDPSFDPASGADGPVLAAAVLGNGKMLIGGDFLYYHGASRDYMSGILNDGKPSGVYRRDIRGGVVRVIALQRDGKILIAGDFNALHNVHLNGIARLTGAGVLDRGFDPGAGANGPVAAVAEQGDGRIIVGGSFTSFNGVGRNGLARLNPDGSLDAAFAPKILGGAVRKVLVQPDGKILVAGRFTNVEGAARPKLARLNPNLSIE
ncbi:MAG TPA: protein kinase [Verrucomicrobiae bacterium]|jgi:uncharacterized delta-60 repeat protein